MNLHPKIACGETFSKVASLSQHFRKNGVPLIFHWKLSRTLDKSSTSSKVKTILLSSLSSVVTDLRKNQASKIFYLIVAFEISLREISFPTIVRER
jgi:hypothetical protein